MAVVVRGSLLASRSALEGSSSGTAPGHGALVALCDVDEDEATLAVEAVVAAAATAGPPPVIGVEGPEALVERVASALPERWSVVAAESASGDVWVVESHAVHPGDRDVDGGGAFARVSGPGLDKDVDVARGVEVDPEALDRLAGALEHALREVPMGAHIPAGTWESRQGVRNWLLASRCERGHAVFPWRGSCQWCGAGSEPVASVRRGRIFATTKIAAGAGPTEFDFLQMAHGEYATVVVETQDPGSTRIPGLLCGPASTQARIGTEVEAVFRRIYCTEGRWRYGVKWRPVG